MSAQVHFAVDFAHIWDRAAWLLNHLNETNTVKMRGDFFLKNNAITKKMCGGIIGKSASIWANIGRTKFWNAHFCRTNKKQTKRFLSFVRGGKASTQSIISIFKSENLIEMRTTWSARLHYLPASDDIEVGDMCRLLGWLMLDLICYLNSVHLCAYCIWECFGTRGERL